MAKKEDVKDKKFRKVDGLSIRGGILTGKVVSDKMRKTVVVERAITKYLPKFKKYARGHSKIKAHNPESINAKVGDTVAIAETRKISKTKAWTVVEILKPGEKQ